MGGEQQALASKIDISRETEEHYRVQRGSELLGRVIVHTCHWSKESGYGDGIMVQFDDGKKKHACREIHQVRFDNPEMVIEQVRQYIAEIFHTS